MRDMGISIHQPDTAPPGQKREEMFYTVTDHKTIREHLGSHRYTLWCHSGYPKSKAEILKVKGLGPISAKHIINNVSAQKMPTLEGFYCVVQKGHAFSGAGNTAEEAIESAKERMREGTVMVDTPYLKAERGDMVVVQCDYPLYSAIIHGDCEAPYYPTDKILKYGEEPDSGAGYLVIYGELVKCAYRWEGGHGRLLETATGDPIHSFESQEEYYSVNSDWTVDLHHPGGILLTLEDCHKLGLKEATWENV